MIGTNNAHAQIIKNFVEKRVEQIEKADIDIFSSDLKRDSYAAALLNTTKLWLLSGPYDRVRKPDWAGFFSKLLREYEMTDEGAAKVEKDLRAAVSGKITDVTIVDVKARPNPAGRSWDVNFSAYDSTTGIMSDPIKDNDFVTISENPHNESVKES